MGKISMYLIVAALVFAMFTTAAFSQSPYGPKASDYRMNIYKTSGGYGSAGLAGPTTLLTAGGSVTKHRVFYQWSLPDNVIPDGATNLSATFEFRASPIGHQVEFGFWLSKIGYDLTGDAAWGTIFDECDVIGNRLVSGQQTGDPNHSYTATFDSLSAFCQAISSQLDEDRFTLGIGYTGQELYDRLWQIATSYVKITITFVPPQQSVTVTQVLESGSPYGYIGHYEESSFAPYQAPHPFSFQVNTTQTFRADTAQAVGTTERFHDWHAPADSIVNHRTFPVTSQLSSIRANFRSAYNVVVQTEPIDGGSGGTVSLMDPWLIDDGSDQKGNRNRGKDAIWHDYSSPLEYSTSHSWHKGAFLNQGLPGWEPPYYSVGAAASQTINGTSAYFLGWTGTGVAFQDASLNTTPIAFTSPGGTAKATYKLHMSSSALLASGYNNQRKICYILSMYHMVYESVGEIWYCKSTDNGSTWSQDVRLSDGSGMNRTPSIACDSKAAGAPYVGVVWERFDAANSHSEIYLSRRDADGSWQSPTFVGEAYGIVQGFVGATPVLTMEPDIQTVVWAVSTSSPYYTSGLHLWTNDLLNDLASTWIIGNTNGSSLYPSTAEDPYANVNGRLGVAWAQSGSIKYVLATYDFEIVEVGYGATETASSGSSAEAHDKPSLTFENVGATNRPVIAWEAFDDLYTYTVNILVRRRESGGWGTITAYSRDEDFTSPSITRYTSSSNLTMTWFQNSANGNMYLAKNTGSWGARINLTPAGKHPTLGYDADGSTDQLRVLYTSGTSAPFALATTNQSLPKSGSSDVVIRRLSKSSKDGVLDVALSTGSLIHGSEEMSLTFADWNEIKTLANEEDGIAFLTTGEFVPQQGTVLKVESIVGFAPSMGSKATKMESSVLLELVDQQTGRVVYSEPIGGEIAAGPARVSSHSLDLSSLSEKALKLTVRVSNEEGDMNWTATTLHYDANGGEPKSSLSKNVVVQDGPSNYLLREAYPNPFNPSTRLIYALPEPSVVELRVFDVLGREVTTLAAGLKASGYHEAQWNASAHASGIYLARLIVKDEVGNLRYTGVTKLLLTK